MGSNFSFLQKYWSDFAQTMEFAEKYVWTDPASSKSKSGLFVELMVREILKIENIPEPEIAAENTSANRTRILKNEGLLPYDVNQWMYQVRSSRNNSVHEGKGTSEEALRVLGFAYHIAVWFMRVYGDGNFKAQPFVVPQKPEHKIDYTKLVLNQEKLLAEQKALIEKLTQERESQNVKTPQAERTKLERQTTSAAAISNTKLTEDQTREIIDEQLRRVGWAADTANIRDRKSVV